MTMTLVSSAVNKIPCCLCGAMILPNAANQCPSCLAQNFDLKSMVQGNKVGDPIIVHQCRQCRKFNTRSDTDHYQYCEPESPQLLTICLKHVPILNKKGHSNQTYNKIHIVDTSWIWTEPHSMRLKLRLTVRTDIGEVTIQQRVPVVFIIKWKMCNNCDRQYTNRTWQALVQLRQKRENGSSRKGLAALEMALGKPSNRDLRKTVLKIDSSRHGLDFYFLSLPQAQHFAHFLSRLAPLKIKTSTKLVSTDAKNNTANIKYTLTCDVVPLCRDDLVLVQKESRSLLGGRLALVTKVASVVHMIDASPKRSSSNHIDAISITAEAYHKNGGGGGTASANDKGCYPILQTAERLVPFVVLDVELCGEDENHANPLYEGPSGGVEKFALADVQLARESDMGANDEILSCVTHLGHLIQPGDVVLGYDLVATAASLNTTVHKAGSTKKGSSFMGASSVVGLEEVLNSNVVLQDVVLVKKISAKQQKRRELAEDLATTQADHDHDMEVNDTKSAGGKNLSKKKLRRQRKRDKKQRELEESAARMGFMDDLAEVEMAREEIHKVNNNNYNDNTNGGDVPEHDEKEFTKTLEDDPELAAEFRAVEKELAEAYPDKGSQEEETSDGEEATGSES
jgi:nonsense-mediated mRNA decay protein 3